MNIIYFTAVVVDIPVVTSTDVLSDIPIVLPTQDFIQDENLFFKVVVEQEIILSSLSKEKKSKEIASYVGEINEKKFFTKDNINYLYENKKQTNYVISTMLDEKGKSSEFETTANTGVSFHFKQNNTDAEKQLIFNISKITGWNEEKIKNNYGSIELIKTPILIELQESIAWPVKYFETTRVFNKQEGMFTIKVFINRKKDLIPGY